MLLPMMAPDLELSWRQCDTPSLQDFHPFHGEQFLSSGMDNTVKIWSLTGVLLRLLF